MISIADLEFQFPQSDFRLGVPSLNVADGDRVAIVDHKPTFNLDAFAVSGYDLASIS